MQEFNGDKKDALPPRRKGFISDNQVSLLELALIRLIVNPDQSINLAIVAS